MKAKTKTEKTKSVRNVKSQEKHYPAYYLAALLAGVLLLEGLLLGAATPQAWQNGLEVLDVSVGFNLVVSDTFTIVEPLLVQMDNVTTFYQMAATEMMVLLDVSEQDPLVFPKTVFRFYEVASIEMEKMLDFSNEFAYFPQVAGASISR